MFDGVFGPYPYWDWQHNKPQAPSQRGLWPLIALFVVLGMFSIVAAVAHPRAFAVGLGQQF